MRFLIYFLIMAAALGFFVYRQKTVSDFQPAELAQPLSPFSPLPPISSPSDPATTTDKTADNREPPTKSQPTEPAKPAPLKTVDQKTLDELQTKLNQTIPASLPSASPPLTQPPPPKFRLSQEELYTKAAARVVNFFCQQGSTVRVASGVIISPQGHILTNAHVGEGFDENFECAIRQDSPARNLAYAKLALFPKAYTNALTRQEQAENDVSIWKIIRLANGDPVSNPFPYYEISTQYYPELNQILSTFSYPSELLGYETLLKNLNLLFAETVVSDFDRDLILSGTGLSSQVGSSGGILVDIYTNDFAGLIFAVSKDEEIAKRKLFSLTPYSIERVIQNETKLDLATFLKTI